MSEAPFAHIGAPVGTKLVESDSITLALRRTLAVKRRLVVERTLVERIPSFMELYKQS
jgi:hypothetical protein